MTLFMDALDKIATIKAGVMGSVFSWFVAFLNDVDWLSVLGAVVAFVTIAAQTNRILMDRRRDRREHERHERESDKANDA